jgi:serine/threonine-protein kinase
MGIFSELRDRRLFQIVASYLAAGWIALEVVDQLVDRTVVPEVLYEVILIGYLCFIPGALLIGWYHGEKGVQKAPRSEVLALTGIAAVFLVFSSFSVSDYRSKEMARLAAQQEAGVDLSKIAVLYFRDYSPGAEYQHVADGFTESLIDELTRVPALQVITRNGAAAFRNSELPRDSIGRALGVGTLVDGTVEQSGSKLRVTVRLFQAQTGAEFKSITMEEPVSDLTATRDKLTEDVARMLRSWLGEEVKVRLGGQRIANPQAWTLYQRAERARKQGEAATQQKDKDAATRAWAAADSAAAQAELLAADWPEPIVLRGVVAYRRSRTAHEQHDVLAFADRALTHAERALQHSPNHAQALELRGTTRYWKYLRTRNDDPAGARRLLADARADLEEAVRIQPLLASAHSTLSHLLYREDVSSAILAARRAYEADAYLDVAADVLVRLTNGNYDIENFDQMQKWCDEASRRFPHDYRFTFCQLVLLTTRQVNPDIDRAWSLLEQLGRSSPEHNKDFNVAEGTALVGGTIARVSRVGGGNAALADSARRVLARARGLITPDVDPEQSLLPETAYMYTLLGDNGTAIELLRRHAASNPHYSFEHHWWWRELRGTAEFQPLLAQRQRQSAGASSH